MEKEYLRCVRILKDSEILSLLELKDWKRRLGSAAKSLRDLDKKIQDLSTT